MGHCLQILKHGSDSDEARNTADETGNTLQNSHSEESVSQIISEQNRGPPAPKQRIFQPSSLQYHAFEALRKYIIDFSVSVVHLVGSYPYELATAIQKCSHLQNMLHRMVPVSFANEVTEKLLLSVNRVDICGKTKKPWRNKILHEIVRAVIHPSISILDVSCGLLLITDILFTRLHTMRKLKVLKLYLMDETYEALVIEGLCVMEDLEVFTLHYHCSNNIMIELGNSCKKLKTLDVAGSTCVSDTSIGSILKLDHLEELILADTSITGEGYLTLFGGLNKSIYKLGCSEFRTSLFNVLLHDFPGLREITVNRMHYDITITIGLKNLQVVRLTDCKFSDIEKLLLTIGNQLIELELDRIRDLDVKVIGKKCLSLQYLTIKGYVRLVPQFEDNGIPLPGFQSIHHLSLHLYRDYSFISYILSECRNVKTVDIFIIDGSEQESDMVVRFVLSRNTLKNLEEFTMKTHLSGLLSLHTAKMLIENCSNITNLKGINTWSSIGILEDFVEEMGVIYPWIHLG